MFKTRLSIPEDNASSNTSVCGPSADSSIGLLSESTLEFLEELNEGMETETGVGMDEAMEPDPRTTEYGQNKLGNAKDNAIKPGGWVLASFPGKVLKVYLGTVLEVDGCEASIKFCHQQGRFFSWPPVDDIGWMPLYNLTPVDVPAMVPRERLALNEATFMKYFKE